MSTSASPLRRATLTLSVCVCLFLFLTTFTNGSQSLDVYRLFQYDHEGESYGSQTTSFSLTAALASAASSSQAGAEGGEAKKIDSMRQVLLVPVVDIYSETTGQEDRVEAFAQRLETVMGSSVGGFLFLLPSSEDGDEAQSDEDEANLTEGWRKFEQWLITQKFDVPVYFARTNDDLSTVLQGAQSSSGLTSNIFQDSYQFVVSAANPSKVEDESLTNIQGWLAGESQDEMGDVPTIAIVTHYDAFAAAPGLATGADANGSGVVALLELARLFSRLYKDPRTRGNYNLAFILTSGGHSNFVGARSFLEGVETRILDTIQFAVCLDSIGDDNELFFHTSKPPTHPSVAPFFNAFASSAKQSGIEFDSVWKKIDISNPVVSWEHEQFARKKVVSATLSRNPEPRALFARSHVLDTSDNVNIDALTRNIKFVAEGLARQVYNLDANSRGVNVFEGSSGLDRDFIERWLTTLSSSSRALPLIDDGLVDALQEVLVQYSSHAARSTHSFDSGYTFYGPSTVTMSVYNVKPALFEVVLSLSVLAYLLAYFVGIKVATGTLSSFISSLFGKSKSA
eukprot:TRINITY_DN10844_c0_g1_i1.p1 TRINITY_DN10844_c0_g1~~TRINITY_DN10844_c0_g1_i1.p1  ORF type:complete len:614 (-),score=173.46 TRINITY_DN10844_c0_g1_i1:110-1813(-)